MSVAAQLSLNDYFESAGIPAQCEFLDKPITGEEHIADIAKELTEWKNLFPYFGLQGYQKEEIEAAGNLSELKRKLLTNGFKSMDEMPLTDISVLYFGIKTEGTWLMWFVK